VNRYLAINIEGKIGQPTVRRTSFFITMYMKINKMLKNERRVMETK